MLGTLVFWILFLTFVAAFGLQVANRVRIIAAAPNTFHVDHFGYRAARWLADVLFQRKTIEERPVAGVAHALVFWGFIAFAGYTVTEFLYGLGIVNLDQLINSAFGTLVSRQAPAAIERAFRVYLSLIHI